MLCSVLTYCAAFIELNGGTSWNNLESCTFFLKSECFRLGGVCWPSWTKSASETKSALLEVDFWASFEQAERVSFLVKCDSGMRWVSSGIVWCVVAVHADGCWEFQYVWIASGFCLYILFMFMSLNVYDYYCFCVCFWLLLLWSLLLTRMFTLFLVASDCWFLQVSILLVCLAGSWSKCLKMFAMVAVCCSQTRSSCPQSVVCLSVWFADFSNQGKKS